MYKIENKEEELTQEEESKDELENSDSVNRQILSLSCVGIGFSNFSKGIL